MRGNQGFRTTLVGDQRTDWHVLAVCRISFVVISPSLLLYGHFDSPRASVVYLAVGPS